MRKISLFSLVALLAVSCSQDSQFEGIAGAEQSNDADNAQLISDFITKNVVDVYDGSFIEVSNIYAQFAGELAKRNSEVLANSLNGVPSTKGKWLTLDFSKVGGEFEASIFDTTWAYTPNEGILKFEFPAYDYNNRIYRECEIVARAEDDNYVYSPFPTFTLKLPQTITDSLFVNGELAGNGIVMSGTVDNAFEILIDRNIADYSMQAGIMFQELSSRFITIDYLNIAKDEETIAGLLSTKTTDGSIMYGLKIDGNNENIMFFISENDVFELAELLSMNKRLLNGEQLDTTIIRDRINAFNANSSLSFDYTGFGNEVEGKVKLMLLKPNMVRNTCSIGFDLSFQINDGSTITINEPVIEAAIESAIEATVNMIIACEREVEHIIYTYVSAVRERLIEIRNGIIEFNKAVIEGINDYNQMVINGIINYNQMVVNGIINYNQMIKTRIQEFERWAAATMSLPYEFFKGLGEYEFAFVNGIVSRIGDFIGNLDEFIEDFFSRN